MFEAQEILNKFNNEIMHVAHNFSSKNPRFNFEDLVSEGRVVAIKASNSFNPDKGVSFHTYLRNALNNELAKFIGNNSYDLYVSENDRKKEWRNDRCESIKRTANAIRLDGFNKDDEGLESVIPSGSLNPEENAIINESLAILNEEIESLEPIEKLVIKGRYLDKKTLATLAEELNVSKQLVHQWQKKAFERLSKRVKLRFT